MGFIPKELSNYFKRLTRNSKLRKEIQKNISKMMAISRHKIWKNRCKYLEDNFDNDLVLTGESDLNLFP